MSSSSLNGFSLVCAELSLETLALRPKAPNDIDLMFDITSPNLFFRPPTKCIFIAARFISWKMAS